MVETNLFGGSLVEPGQVSRSPRQGTLFPSISQTREVYCVVTHLTGVNGEMIPIHWTVLEEGRLGKLFL